jgi:AcrR family transcriptional regulator
MDMKSDEAPSATNRRIIDNLAAIFRKYGYDAASLSMLQEATGLGKSSLYHHFPDGKAQMVQAVIDSRGRWLRDNVFGPLRDDRAPDVRIKEMLRFLNRHYAGGVSVCLLGMLVLSENSKQYRDRLSAVFAEWIDALSVPLIDAGMGKADALRLSRMAITMVQGALVMTRALGTNRPFGDALQRIRLDLLGALRKVH